MQPRGRGGPRPSAPRAALAAALAAPAALLVWQHGRLSEFLSAPGQPPPPRSPPPPLPLGWRQLRDPGSGRVFYHNPARSLTQWANPDEERDAQQAAARREWLGRFAAGLGATLYSGAECSGEARSFNLSHRAARCRSCLDTCDALYASGAPLHRDSGPTVRSARVHGTIGGLRTHHACVGQFEYPGAEAALLGAPAARAEHGCTALSGQAHFRLVLDSPAASELLRRAADTIAAVPRGAAQRAPPADEAAPLSRHQGRDWLRPVLRKGDVFRNWTTRFVTPETRAGERLLPCGAPAADAGNAQGVALVRAHLQNDTLPREVADPAAAEPFFAEAARLAPQCPTPRLNLAVVLAVRLRGAGLVEGREHAAEAARLAQPGALRAKALLWVAIYDELRSTHQRGGGRELGAAAERGYHAAFAEDDSLPLRYFGRPHRSWGARGVPPVPRLFHDPSAAHGRRRAAQLQERAACKLLLYQEFAEHYGGYGSMQRSEAERFLDQWAALLPRLVPPYPLAVLREAYRALVASRYLKWQTATTPGRPVHRWTQHNGPLGRLVQAALLPRIESLAQRPLMPTYSFMGAYARGGGIMPHLDREMCEYTLTATVDASPYSGSCPFGAATEPNVVRETGYTDDPFPRMELPPEANRTILDSFVGDGALVRGRSVVHWRPPNPGANCTQFFMHYVLRSYSGPLD